MKRFLLLLAALSGLIFFGSPAVAATKWLRADTHNFIIYSSGNRDQLEKFATDIERFDAVLRMRFKREPEEHPSRLTIYLLNSQDAVGRLMGDRWLAGYYSSEKDGSYAVANRENAASRFELSAQTVLFHEYAHHFMYRNFTYAYPAWYVEGFAEFVSTVAFKPDGTYTFGRAAFHRAYGLLQLEKMPVEQIMFGDRTKFTSNQREVFYGRSWLLVHMLMMKPEYGGKVGSFLRAVGEGAPERAAATAAFGDPAALDKSLNAYLAGRISYFDAETAVPYDRTLTITALDDIDGQLVMLQLARRRGDEGVKTRDSLKALTTATPGRAAVWYELALVERSLAEDGTRDAAERLAEAAVDRALVADPRHVRANVLKADILTRRLQDNGDDVATRWRDARGYITKANAEDNNDPAPLAMWYESFVRQGKEPTATASLGLARAFELQPEVTELRVGYAFDLARQKKFDQAIALIEFLAHDPHGGQGGASVLATLKMMRDRANEDAPSTPSITP